MKHLREKQHVHLNLFNRDVTWKLKKCFFVMAEMPLKNTFITHQPPCPRSLNSVIFTNKGIYERCDDK